MDRTLDLARLGRLLAMRSAVGDWDAVTGTDRDLAAALRRLPAPASLDGAERHTLAEVRRIHEQAWARCRREREKLEERLRELRAAHEAARAYVIDGEDSP